ncbi:TonB-dependent receptor [Aureisphaera galaxeae]|uniref:TonB-dependent receptor domain-containing protein n=1 Tax=Aureisphaera galaxeae TaxID=1538023 RepID=UPI0023505F26|nr:TonB-dependent receptor [Aureisphaera galaxeae]MDC8004752.1 TonB-dependent receptor [Aureisphaera galaxeae]
MMKKWLFLWAMVLLPVLISAQETKTITVSFQDEGLKEALLKIESATGLQFYFVDEWLKEKRITANYTETPLEEVLNDLFTDTIINYYILDGDKVILTQNNIIYDQLPEEFFGKEETTDPQPTDQPVGKTVTPIFNTITNTGGNTPMETVRIGKETKGNNASSFTLSGTISDEDGKPLPNVTLVVRNSGLGTTTNASGAYRITLRPGVNRIEIRSLGFRNLQKRIIIYNNGQLDITLEEGLEQLDAVVLEGSAKQNVAEVSTGVTEIDVKEIKNIPLVLGERDILKVATTLPGITTAGEGSSGFNVRGGKEDQNLILLDDGVVYNPTHFFGIFSGINPFTTEDAKIYKGNIPAEYGGRLSSVVDIITKDANTEKFSAEGSIGPVTGSLSVEVPIEKEKGAFLVGGRSTYSNWILRSLDDEALQNSEANFFDVIAKYNHKIGEKDDIKFTGYYSNDAFSITSDSLYSYSNRMASLRWNHEFNENHRGSIAISNSNYQFGIEFDGQSNNDFDLGYDLNETKLKLKMESNVGDNHTLSYGLASKLYNVSPGEIEPINGSSVIPLTIPDEKGWESALFISDDWNVTDEWQLSAGIRYSYFSALGPGSQNIYADGLPRNEATFIESREFADNESIETYGGPEFRLSTRYFLTSDLSVKASFNTTYQYIHTLTNNTTVSPTDTWKLSDLNIKPQEASQYSLGFYKNLNDNMFEISLEGYYKTLDNVLDFKTGAELLLNETIETEVLQGEGRAYGVEFLLRKRKGNLNGWLGYTYSRSEQKFESAFSEETINNGNYFPSNFDKPHDISLVANYKLTKRFSFSANFVYQTGRPVTVPVGNFFINNSEFVLYSERNKFRIPDYYRFDISFNVEGNHKNDKLAHSFWNISIYNVLGRNNPYSVFFVTEEGQVKALQSSIFSIPVPTITYNFKF